MKRITGLSLLLTFYISFAFGAESFSYSGRLINSNGSPVPGPVDLSFELAYSNQLGILLCSQNLNGVMLSNGVFHANLDFPDCDLKEILDKIPANNNLMIRVVDKSSSNPNNYSFQAIHSIPLSLMSHMSRQLLQMEAKLGQVLTWDGTKWAPADPAITSKGTVTSLTIGDGLYGGTITESGIIGIQDGGVTSQKLAPMGALTTGQVLKWNGSMWMAGGDSGLISESDPTVKNFAKIDLPICGADEYYTHDVIVGFRCEKINSDLLNEGSNHLFFTDTRAKAAVVDQLALKQEKIDATVDVKMKSLTLTNGDGTWATIQVPEEAGNKTFVWPGDYGSEGQVLKTTALGVLGWANLEVNSSSISSGAINNSHIAAGANIEQAKIAGLTSDLTAIDTRITNLKTNNILEDPSSLYFTELRVLGTKVAGINTSATGTVDANDSILLALGKIVGNANALSGEVSTLTTNQSNYLEKGGGSMGGNLAMGGNLITDLGAPSIDSDAATKKYVDDEIALSSHWSKVGSEVSYLGGPVSVGDKLRLKSTNTNYVEIQSPPTLTSTITFTLPGSYGTNNQFLKTDASGKLSWANVTAGTITEITTSAPLVGSGNSGSVNLSLSVNSLTDSHIAPAANIDWSKINKSGALASDIGAVPATRQIITSTGLLGGGNLSADRTLSVDVGTNTGQIIQVGLDGKLPVVDGSKLTNFTWSQILPATLPLINAGTGITSTGSLASGQTLNVDIGTTANKIVSLDGSARLPAVDGSQLTNLGTNLGKWSDATGGINYPGGNVGIGTSTPSAKLDVADGDVNFDITKGITSDVGAKLITGPSGHTWQTFPGDAIAASFIANNFDGSSGFGVYAGGNVGIGTTTPSGILDINIGTTSRLVKYIGAQPAPYIKSVILLHEVYTGTLLNENHAIGRIFGRRGSYTSLHRHEVADIRTGSAYNGTSGQLTSLSSGNLKWKLVTVIYNGIKYMAVEVPYADANLSSGLIFDGFVKSTVPDSLKFIDYYNVQSGTVLNAEINSSIADFTPSGQESKDVGKFTVSGILGVGTHSPAAPLDVALHATDNPNSPAAIFARGSDHNFQMMAMSGSALNTNGSLIGKLGMRYVGGLGVGDTAMMRFYRGTTNLDGRMAIATNDLDRLTVSAVGNVGIGTDAPGYKLTVNGQPAANGYTAFTNYSDRRLKENMERVGDGVLEKVLALKPTTFNYNDKYFDITGYDPETKKIKVTGFIAQELKEVFPEMVNEKKISDESFLDTNLSSLQIYLVKAIKEMFARWQSDSQDLHDEIQYLKSREIASIKKENQELKDKVMQKEKEMAQMQAYLCKKDPLAPFCKR